MTGQFTLHFGISKRLSHLQDATTVDLAIKQFH